MRLIFFLILVLSSISVFASNPLENFRSCLSRCVQGNHVSYSCESNCKSSFQSECNAYPRASGCDQFHAINENDKNFAPYLKEDEGEKTYEGESLVDCMTTEGTSITTDCIPISNPSERSSESANSVLNIGTPSRTDTGGTDDDDDSSDSSSGGSEQAETAEGSQGSERDSSSEKQTTESSEDVAEDNVATEPKPDEPTAGMDANSIYQYYNAKIEKCEADRKYASMCCREPMRCLAEDAGMENGSGVNMAAQVGLSLAQQLSSMNANSMSSLCGNLKSLGMMGAGMNAGYGKYCSMKREVCTESCAMIYQEIDQAKKDCEYSSTCPQDVKGVYSKLSGRASEELKSCVALKNYESQYYAQATSTGAGAFLASKCEDATKVSNFSTGFENVDSQVFNTDCSDPVNASNPICQSQCQRPGAANDPVCRQILGLDGAENAGLASSMGSSGSGAGNDGGMEKFGIYEDPDLNQEFEGAGIAPQANSANVGSQGGGGIPSGSAGGGGGGSAAASGGGGRASSGYNTNILKGFSGGNGYSTKIANRYSASGGGFSGYGNKKSKSAGEKFNLKDYLPGGKKDPRKRRIASVYGLSKQEVQQIGKSHENIFQKISNRYYQVCLKGLLMDCTELFGKQR